MIEFVLEEDPRTWTVGEHVAEAERLLNGPNPAFPRTDKQWRHDRADNLAEALVHATLAVAVAGRFAS